MFLDLSLHHTVRSSNAMRAEQNSPAVSVSIIKHEINKCVSADPLLWYCLSKTHFLTRLRQCFPVTRYIMF